MTINYKYANMLRAGSFGLNVLSPDDLDQIHMATLDVMWSIGIKVDSATARQLLGDNGAMVMKNPVVKIPSNLVEDAIISTPAAYRAHAINPENEHARGPSR